MKYLYPLIIKDLDFKYFNISSEIRIRRIKSEELEKFFGLKKVECDYNPQGIPRQFGHIKICRYIPSNNKRGALNYSRVIMMIPNIWDDVLASNYLVEISVQNKKRFDSSVVRRMNLAFKIYRPTSTGISLCFYEGNNGVSYDPKNIVLNGPFDYLEIRDKKEFKKIKEIYHSIEAIEISAKRKRFEIFSDLYLKALSGENISLEFRFVMIVIFLEAIFVNNNYELRFKFSLRVSKLLGNEKNNKEYYYKLAQKIYDVRSGIVHNGTHKELDWKLFAEATDIAKRSINLFLENNSIFEEDNLLRKCLD